MPEWLKSGSYKITDYKQKPPKSSDVRFKYVIEPVKLTLEGYNTNSRERPNDSAAGPPTTHSAPSILNLFDTEDEKITKVHHHQNMYENHLHAHSQHLDKTGKLPLNTANKYHHPRTSYHHDHLLTTQAPVGHGQPAPMLQNYDVKKRPGVIRPDPIYTVEPPDFIYPMAPVTPMIPMMPTTPTMPAIPMTPMIRSHSRPPFVEIYHGKGKRHVPYPVPTSGQKANVSSNHAKVNEVHYDNTYLLPPNVSPEQYTSIESSSRSISPDTKDHRIQTITRMDEMMHAQPTAGKDSVLEDIVERQGPVRSQKTLEYLPGHFQISPFLRMESPLKEIAISEETQTDKDNPASTKQILVDNQDRDQSLSGRGLISPTSQDGLNAIILHKFAVYPTSLKPDPIKQINSSQQTESDMPIVTPEPGLLGSRDPVTKYINNQSQLATGSNLTATRNVVDDIQEENSQHEQSEATSTLSSQDREAAPQATQHKILLVVGEKSLQGMEQIEHIPNLPPSINTHPYKGSVLRTYSRLTH